MFKCRPSKSLINKGLPVRHKVLDSDTYYLVYYVHNGEKMITNGLQGIHLATNQPIEIPLNTTEMSYATDKNRETSNASWEYMCAMVSQRTGIDIIDNIQIDWIVIDGIKRVFH